MPKLQRQATLAKHFFFVCECERCAKEEPSFMDGYRCVDPKCTGAVTKSTRFSSSNNILLLTILNAFQLDGVMCVINLAIWKT
jgi:hypothetical protein